MNARADTPSVPIVVARLEDADRAAWQVLAEAYKRFYRTELPADEYEKAWRRLRAGDDVHAFGARFDGCLVGIVHYLFHTTVWTGTACYLQDLYVDDAGRGRGVGRSLVERVAAAAREHGATRLHWLTAGDNVRARRLYDRIAHHAGFIRYDYRLE